MAESRQHKIHEKKLMEMVKDMPHYVAEYVDDKLDSRSPSTLLNYVHDFKIFFEWLIDQKIANCQEIKDIPYSVLENLKLEQAKKFVKYLQRREIKVTKDETKKPEKVSVNRKISALRSLFKYLTTQTENENGEPYFYRNVMLKIEVNKVKETLGARASKISTQIFQNNEDTYFLYWVQNEYENELPKNSRKRIYFKRDRERDVAILSLFLGSGIRVNELANLRLKDLDFEKNRITVIRKGGKKDTISVIPESMLDVKKYLEVRPQRYNASNEDNEYVFVTKTNNVPTPLSNRSIETIVKKYTKAYKTNKAMSPHKLRHTYATNLMEETGDIHLLMRQLGHSSTTTAALYSNPEEQKAAEAAEQLGKRRKQAIAEYKR
ncbi:tyrosine recombinase XerS (plasmid) [Bacillus methanolicus]|uniref:tyrosine recombinase XerS n=1 Tax=Bacillus methanolicus TaxID=1471 RepID=UPI00238075D9|nr:tyrosine recombinase XerS [Bacillus methanolicus]MDE3841053.1 tyrosine recombinase XerS [Bacillus methanolicus]